MSPRLIALVVAAVLALGGLVYVTHMQARVNSLQQKVLITEDKLRISQEQLAQVTLDKLEFEKKALLAKESISQAEEALKRARARVRYVEIPSACPDAVDWLLKEAQK